MVTSNKLPDKKVVKMAEQKNSVVVPQRTLLGEVNEHITCPLCRGYYIDATTIVECLHSFCRSCIIKHLQVKSYCPVCEMMINSAKPNIKLDKALQDIVYKLVPGLFQREMDRRQQFYASRPGPAATATPEQRGEDTERIIFSPEDVISFSLEYADATDADSISSKSSDSNEPQAALTTTRRYLQCPAVVNISHLKKFLSMKFDIDSTQFAIDILYKRVPLPDYYTLMDIAYIYNWKRNEPMRFFYQIIDYVAIRNRLFDINRKESHFGDRKSSPTSTEDTNVSSPAHNLNDHGSEASSGTNSPMPDDNNTKQVSDTSKNNSDKAPQQCKDLNSQDNIGVNKNTVIPPSKKNDEDEEKSQFLISFELTAKNNCTSLKSSPVKSTADPDVGASECTSVSKNSSSPKVEDNLKRKHQTPLNIPEMKKLRVEIEKTKITALGNSANVVPVSQTNQNSKPLETSVKSKSVEVSSKNSPSMPTSKTLSIVSAPVKDDKKETQQSLPITKPTASESVGIKRTVTGTQNNISSPKRKPSADISTPQSPSTAQKTVSPLKIQVPRSEPISTINKATDVSTTPVPTVKKIPDLKPSSMASPAFSNKQPVNKVRMDLLANNSDIDRSKIMPPVKSPINSPNVVPNSGDPLKSLFDSCKINIPSSLSITLTDQKLESRNPTDPVNVEQKKNVLNKNLSGATSTTATTHKVPSPPVHNYIQILKLPDTDPKKNNKSENNPEAKLNPVNKPESSSPISKPPNKTSETSAKGPIPNLKPIADTKLGKQSGNFSAPITFQQTFEQQLQSLQSDKKTKVSRNKPQVPKLVPATPKALSAANKPSNPNSKPSPNSVSGAEPKTSSALDLSTTNNIPNQLGPQQTIDKAFETMQSIANLAKKQTLQSKGLQIPMSQSNIFPGISNRPLTAGIGPLRIPSTATMPQMKSDKVIPNSPHSTRQEMPTKNNTLKPTNNVSSTVPSPGYPIPSHSSSNTAQPSPRSQTRSPSSSPKLVIAEEKQVGNSMSEQSVTQPNQTLNTQLSNMANKSESSKASPGPSKPAVKPVKPLTPTSKMPMMRQSQTPSLKPNPMLNSSEYQVLLRHQFEMNNWIKVQQKIHYDMYKNTLSQQSKNEFSDKDKQ